MDSTHIVGFTRSEIMDLEALLPRDWYSRLTPPRNHLRAKLTRLFEDAGLYDHDERGDDSGHPDNFGDS